MVGVVAHDHQQSFSREATEALSDADAGPGVYLASGKFLCDLPRSNAVGAHWSVGPPLPDLAGSAVDDRDELLVRDRSDIEPMRLLRSLSTASNLVASCQLRIDLPQFRHKVGESVDSLLDVDLERASDVVEAFEGLEVSPQLADVNAA